MSGQDLEVIEVAEYLPAERPAGTLFGTDDPVAVIEKATRAASALMDAVKRHDKGKPPPKRLVSVIQGREFPKLECWTLLGSMLGVFPVLEGQPEQVEINGVAGWKATVAAQSRDGSVVGRASALCMRSEKNWSDRDEYTLMSMAQTRAASKALSQPLRFVMVLAGLEGTPEAEMAPDPGPPGPPVAHDGHEPAKQAKGYDDWVARMVALEVPRPEEWAAAAASASGVAKSGRMQRLNRVLLWFSDCEPASPLGFWSTEEIQAGFAVGFEGVVVELPPVEPERPAEEPASSASDDGIEFAPELPLVEGGSDVVA